MPNLDTKCVFILNSVDKEFGFPLRRKQQNFNTKFINVNLLVQSNERVMKYTCTKFTHMFGCKLCQTKQNIFQNYSFTVFEKAEIDNCCVWSVEAVCSLRALRPLVHFVPELVFSWNNQVVKWCFVQYGESLRVHVTSYFLQELSENHILCPLPLTEINYVNETFRANVTFIFCHLAYGNTLFET